LRSPRRDSEDPVPEKLRAAPLHVDRKLSVTSCLSSDTVIIVRASVSTCHHQCHHCPCFGVCVFIGQPSRFRRRHAWSRAFQACEFVGCGASLPKALRKVPKMCVCVCVCWFVCASVRVRLCLCGASSCDCLHRGPQLVDGALPMAQRVTCRAWMAIGGTRSQDCRFPDAAIYTDGVHAGSVVGRISCPGQAEQPVRLHWSVAARLQEYSNGGVLSEPLRGSLQMLRARSHEAS
jgi:hypothetical protein